MTSANCHYVYADFSLFCFRPGGEDWIRKILLCIRHSGKYLPVLVCLCDSEHISGGGGGLGGVILYWLTLLTLPGISISYCNSPFSSSKIRYLNQYLVYLSAVAGRQAAMLTIYLCHTPCCTPSQLSQFLGFKYFNSVSIDSNLVQKFIN